MMPGSCPCPCTFAKLISLSSNLPQFLNSRPGLNSFPVEPGLFMSAFLPSLGREAEISLGRTVHWLRVTSKSVCCFFFLLWPIYLLGSPETIYEIMSGALFSLLTFCLREHSRVSKLTTLCLETSAVGISCRARKVFPEDDLP